MRCFKINTDRSCKGSNGRTSCGGVIRVHLGEWMRDFSKFVGCCSSLEAELWSVYSGIFMAWNMSLRNVIVESDCVEAIKLIHHDDRLGGSLAIVRYIREFYKKDWCLSFICINRNNNRVVDALATTVSTTDLRLLEFEEPQEFVLTFLQEDLDLLLFQINFDLMYFC
ncbi:hypothetical protein V6N13_042595 [Hibiscus sabdariffa]|uniref:RNase H type-1 domain-containing protein n=1 Tax=Hibiscus sabdariffa TaxID=183260 RepID=A0ABR2G431_9ROSI